MRRLIGRLGRRGAIGVAAALVLASCGIGETQAPEDITDVSALLTGVVGNKVTGPTTYWFEYGPTTAYGATTPEGTVDITTATTQRIRVTANVGGLTEGTEYHYRLCAVDVDDHGVCGIDQTFTTTSGRDSVTGSGTIFVLPELGYADGARISATSDPDGSNPTGHATHWPGTAYFRLADVGPVTCLRVEGNRAAVGMMGKPEGFEEDPTAPTFPILMFVEDNGPTGDRYSVGTIAAPATDCPVPTDADFVPGMVGGVPIGPELTSGDFIIHDHPTVP